jgi:outer membrane protein TolC
LPIKEINHSPTPEEEVEAEEEMLKDNQPWHVDNLIDVALRNNPDTRVTWQNARSAAFLWRASRSTLYPTVNLSEQLLFQKITGAGIGGGIGAANATGIVNTGDANNNIIVGGGGTGSVSNATSSNSVYNQWLITTISLSYLMLDFGGRMASIEAARQALFNADWTHNRQVQTVILNVLTFYYKHLEARALLSARALDLKEAKENMESAQEQFDAGVVTIVDVLQARSAYVNIQYQMEQLRGQTKTTLGQLATAMGMPANAQFEVVPLPEDLQVDKVHKDIDELIATAKSQRPDLAAAEANWKALEADVTVAWSAGMPTLMANSLMQNTDNINTSFQDSRYYSGSIILNVPIFSGFYYVNQTRSARANAAAAFAKWKSQEDNALLEVVISYADFSTAVQQIKFADENYTFASQAYEAALANYKFGVNTILDVLSAEAALSNARAQKIQSRTFWIISLTNIAYAIGTL